MEKCCRLCPKCGKEISYKNKSQLNEANRKNRVCVKCKSLGRKHSETFKANMSRRMSGTRNPMYGKDITEEHRRKLSESKTGVKNVNYGKSRTEDTKLKISIANTGKVKSPEAIKKQADALRGRPGPNLGRKFSAESRQKMSDSFKKRILNKGFSSGWCGWYKGWFFRSISELRYVVEEVESNNLKWQTAETSELSIEYTHPDGSQRVYHADLFVNNLLLVEVKPKFYHNNEIVVAKRIAAEDFCEKLGLKYELVDAIPLNYVKLKELCDSKEVMLSSKSQESFNKKLGAI